MSAILTMLDLAGTFVFALSGALTAVRHRLDLFGVLVLSFAAATAGGIARDVLLGAVPPAALEDWRYVLTSAAAGLLTFYFFPRVERLRESVLAFDAAGLALFAVSGALKALVLGMGPVGAILLGTLTGIGGGIARDLLVAETPVVLRSEFYAVAAIAGAAVAVLSAVAGLPVAVGVGAGAASCFLLRLVAIRRRWQLPVAEPTDAAIRKE